VTAFLSAPVQVLGQYNIDARVKEELVKNIERRLTPQPVKVRADLEITCFTCEGIEAIKAAIRAGQVCDRRARRKKVCGLLTISPFS
jgi:translation initiation factor 2 subunit 1